MITKNFSQICQHDLGTVIRCVASGRAKKIPYIIAGCIDSSLYILDKNCIPLQKVAFGNWVRCCAMGDIDGDGDDEIVAGSGDKTVKILKLIGDKFQEVRSLDFSHIVNACAIADLTGEGTPQILVGTWGGIVYALDAREYRILWQKEFRGWINFIVPGDVTGSGRTDLLIGTRDGVFYVVEGTDGHPIWDYTFPKEINAAAIADVDNSGVPSILVGGNSNILSIFNSQGNILREIPLQNRILSIAIGDIDGDHANEIILGCGDNTLRVLENRSRDVDGISLKWRGNFGNTIRGIQINDLLENGINEIIFGGYNKVIQAIKDFHWGEKPMIEVYPVPVATTPSSVIEPGAEFFFLEKINRIEDLLANSSQELLALHETRKIPHVDIVTEAPTNQKGENSDRKTSLPDVLSDIIIGKATPDAEKSNQIPRVPSHLLPKIAPVIPQPALVISQPALVISQPAPVISQPAPVIPQPAPVIPQPAPVIPQPLQAPIIAPLPPVETKTTVVPFAQYCDQVVDHLKTAGIFSSKAKLSDSIKSIGIPEDAIEGVIAKLIEDQRLAYSRTAPRGYALVGMVPVAPVKVKKAAKRVKSVKRVKKPAITPIIESGEIPPRLPTENQISAGLLGQYCDQVVDHLKTAGIFSSKAKLSDSIKSIGVPEDAIEGVIAKLIEDQRLAYSRTAPRGYALVGMVPVAPVKVKKAAKRAKSVKRVKVPTIAPVSIPEVPTSPISDQAQTPQNTIVPQEALMQEKAVTTEMVQDVNIAIDLAYTIIKKKGIIASKSELVKSLQDGGIAPNLSESIINELKNSGRLVYSRATPRGYSVI